MNQKTLLLFSITLLAGCITNDEPTPDTSPTEPPQPTADKVLLTDNGTITVVNRMGGPGYWFTYFQMNNSIQWILAELVWDDPIVDLDLVLNGPGGGCNDIEPPYECSYNDRLDDFGADRPGYWQNRGGMVGQPDSPSRLVIHRPAIDETIAICAVARPPVDDCKPFRAGIHPGLEDLGVMVEWQLYVTLGLTEDFDPNYSAIAQGP